MAICTRTFIEGFCKVTFVTLPIVTPPSATGFPARSPWTLRKSAKRVIDLSAVSVLSAR